MYFIGIDEINNNLLTCETLINDKETDLNVIKDFFLDQIKNIDNLASGSGKRELEKKANELKNKINKFAPNLIPIRTLVNNGNIQLDKINHFEQNQPKKYPELIAASSNQYNKKYEGHYNYSGADVGNDSKSACTAISLFFLHHAMQGKTVNQTTLDEIIKKGHCLFSDTVKIKRQFNPNDQVTHLSSDELCMGLKRGGKFENCQNKEELLKLEEPKLTTEQAIALGEIDLSNSNQISQLLTMLNNIKNQNAGKNIGATLTSSNMTHALFLSEKGEFLFFDSHGPNSLPYLYDNDTKAKYNPENTAFCTNLGSLNSAANSLKKFLNYGVLQVTAFCLEKTKLFGNNNSTSSKISPKINIPNSIRKIEYPICIHFDGFDRNKYSLGFLGQGICNKTAWKDYVIFHNEVNGEWAGTIYPDANSKAEIEFKIALIDHQNQNTVIFEEGGNRKPGDNRQPIFILPTEVNPVIPTVQEQRIAINTKFDENRYMLSLYGEGFVGVNWTTPKILIKENGQWATYVELDPNCKAPKFKFVLVDLDNGDMLIWEQGDNRKLGDQTEPKFF